jgi:hypothetical protein
MRAAAGGVCAGPQPSGGPRRHGAGQGLPLHRHPPRRSHRQQVGLPARESRTKIHDYKPLKKRRRRRRRNEFFFSQHAFFGRFPLLLCLFILFFFFFFLSRRSGIKIAGTTLMARALRFNPRLRQLDLTDNTLGFTGFACSSLPFAPPPPFVLWILGPLLLRPLSSGSAVVPCSLLPLLSS